MSATCLSLAPNLRCQLLTQPQLFIVLIPPTLETIFCISLCVIKRGSDRKHFLLAGEGLLYFLLALLDAVAHLLKGVSTSLPAFKAFDIVIGIFTAVPLFMFTLYLAILTADELLPTFPLRLQRVMKYTLLLFIPIVLLLNALGSFFNLKYTTIRESQGPTPFVEWKYASEQVETFINSLTLVIFLAFQAMTFVACFLRLLKAFLDQRRIDGTENGNDNEVVLFNGLGWVAGGIKLGAIETVIGFVGGSFCMIFTRRMLRMLGRACLIIGASKGMDVVEDFSMFNRRRSARRLRAPRSSMFSALLSPRRSFAFRPMSEVSEPKTARQSNAMTVAALARQPTSPSPAILPPMQPLRPAVSLDSHLLQIHSPGKHVIVKYGHDRAPTLDLRRFSELVVPLPTVPPQSEKGNTRPPTGSQDRNVNHYSPVYPRPRLKSLRAFSLPPARSERMPLSMISSSATRGRLSVRTTTFSEQGDGGGTHPSATTVSTQSQKSFLSSLAGVQAIASEFPGVPRPWKQYTGHKPSAAQSPAGAAIPADSRVYRFPRPRSASTDSGVDIVRRVSSVKRKPVPTLEDLERLQPDSGLRSTSSAPPALSSGPPTPNTPSAVVSPPASRRESRRSRSRSYYSASQSASPKSSRFSHGVENPWMPGNRDIVKEGRAELDMAWQQLGKAGTRESIKSVGSVSARRWTPTPSYHTSSHRGSMVPEWHGTDDTDPGEHMRRSIHPLRSTSSFMSVISDSPTLGV